MKHILSTKMWIIVIIFLMLVPTYVAKDTKDDESEYKSTLDPSFDVEITGGCIIIRNTGDVDLTNVEYFYKIYGWLVIGERSISGIIENIPPGEEETRCLGLIFGVGPVILYSTVKSDEIPMHSYSKLATILLFSIFII